MIYSLILVSIYVIIFIIQYFLDKANKKLKKETLDKLSELTQKLDNIYIKKAKDDHFRNLYKKKDDN